MSEWKRRLDVDFRLNIGPLDLDIRFQLTQPWTFLFAPSGTGKTTILRVIAGLERPQTGHVRDATTIGDQPERLTTLSDTSAGLFVPPHRRSIGLIAQRPAIFPHLSVEQNIDFKRNHAYGRDAEERRQVDDQHNAILDLCHVTHLLGRTAAQLSGGERQRVALARTLAASRFRLLLLDEPFSGIDLELRSQILANLRPWLRRFGTPVLQVTHDLSEVLAADAHVLQLEAGRIVASGPAQQVLGQQRDFLLRLLQPPPST